jgi:site-specific recombinase XerD
MADLTVDSVRIIHEPCTIRLVGKGRKARIVPLVREQVSILREYMGENRLNDGSKASEPLFCNNRHEKLTREGVSHILKIYAEMARKESPELIPKKFSCHLLRHSRAMHLLQAGVNPVYIRYPNKNIILTVKMNTNNILHQKK